MKKEDIVYSVGVIRRSISERRKLTFMDAELIVHRLSLCECSESEVERRKGILDEFIENKISYFVRKNNKSKIEEYRRIRKRNIALFEFFLENKEKFCAKSQ